jgi:tRNA(Ile)-lysidine synthase
VLTTIVETVRRHAMLPAGARVAVAVSGGPDSVALLHALRELAPRLGFVLTAVAHVNHQLRGAESEQDQRFVGALAAGLGLGWECRQAPPAGSGNLEQAARRLRQAFFRELIERGVADRVALGHTRDDQAETVLFRLLRGAGPAGLAGILPVTADGMVRPLLEVSRREVRAYLQTHGLAWREDSSNRSPRFARNRIRQELLPQLERDWNPRLSTALAQLADLAYEDERQWSALLEPHLKAMRVEPGAAEIPLAAFEGLSRAFQRRWLRQAILAARGSLTRIEYAHIEAVLRLAFMRAPGRVTLPGLVAARSCGWLRLSRTAEPAPPAPLPIRDFGPVAWPEANPLIRLELSPMRQPPDAYDTLRVEFPASGLELRAWRPGDAYQPAGKSRVWKLTELFQQARVPSWRRASWPILSSEGKVLWARQFGPAAGLEWLAVRESGESP